MYWWASGCLSLLSFSLRRWLANLRATPRKGEQSVSLSQPVYCLATASPVQCLLVMAGVKGYREAPTLNLEGRLLYSPTVDQREEEKTPNGCDSGWGCTSYILSQRWIRRNRRRLSTAVKAEEGMHKYI